MNVDLRDAKAEDSIGMSRRRDREKRTENGERKEGRGEKEGGILG